MSLPRMLLTRNIERRALLMGTFALFIARHVLTAFAWNFWVLMCSRIGVALAHEVFWSITASLAIRVAPKGKSAQTLSLLTTGTGLAIMLSRLPSNHSGSCSVPELFRRPALVSIYGITVVLVTAHYTAYSYIEPFMQRVAAACDVILLS